MTKSPYRSWILQNRHCRWIQNGPNSRELVWLGWIMGQKWAKSVKKLLWMSVGSLGLNRKYSRNILRLDGTARHGNMARIWINRLLPLGASIAGGLQNQTFRRHMWATSYSDKANFCTHWVCIDELHTMEWSKRVFDNFKNSDVSQKNSFVFDKQGSDTNCWWERPLIVALKHSKRINTLFYFNNKKLTNN